MNGETSPLLSPAGTPTPTIRSDDDSYYSSQDPRASFSWLIPVVVIATLANGLTTYSRQSFFRQFVCEEIGGLPSTPDPSLLQIDGGIHSTAFSRLDCTSPSPLAGTLSLNVASMITTCVLSALSTGWWSRFGDRHGRRYALMIPVLGSILLNVAFVLIAGSSALEGLAQPLIFVGFLLNGLLGGEATFQGAVHACLPRRILVLISPYFGIRSDVVSRSSIFSVLQGLFILCTVLGSWSGFGMDFMKPFLTFGVSAILGGLNLAFIFFFLPESLPEEFQDARSFKPILQDVRSSIYSTITVFFTGHRLAFLGFAFFLYSLTSNVELYELLVILKGDLPAGFFMTFALLARMGTFFLLFPATLYLLKRRTPLSLATTTKQYFSSVISIDGSAARYFVWADFISQLLIILVPTSSSAISILLALITPLTIGIKPALYALSAVSFEVISGASQRGAVFGAISVVGMVGETLSYIMYVSTFNFFRLSSVKAGFMVTAALLALVAVFLWPGEQPQRISRESAERIRIIVSDESQGSDPSTFSPVYRRHGVAGDSDACRLGYSNDL
ncbi:hypothetical protein C8R47DRAFT_1266749 [Mycena vitilis]|nr:hypothetical protein C8R47DRAFT_1266749 [Mycena vitilis]